MSGKIDNLMELLLSIDESNVEIGKILTESQNLKKEGLMV